MGKLIDPILQKIRKTLVSRGFDVENSDQGICVMTDSIGIPGGTLDFYTLKKNPEQIRARLGKKSTSDFSDTDETAALCLHSLFALEYTRSKLIEGLLGVAIVEKFHYYGYKNETHYYYARVKLAEESEEEVLKRTLAEKSIYQLKGVDSKIFRESLDILGLPRSSISRLALTRIFRGSTDSDELLHVLSEEASKIVGSEDWKTIRKLMEESKNPFLSNILLLLWEEISRIVMKKAWDTLHD